MLIALIAACLLHACSNDTTGVKCGDGTNSPCVGDEMIAWGAPTTGGTPSSYVVLKDNVVCFTLHQRWSKELQRFLPPATKISAYALPTAGCWPSLDTFVYYRVEACNIYGCASPSTTIEFLGMPYACFQGAPFNCEEPCENLAPRRFPAMPACITPGTSFSSAQVLTPLNP